MKKIISVLAIVSLVACNGQADTAAEKDSIQRADSLNKAVDSAKQKMEKMMDTANKEVKMMGDTTIKMK